MKVFDLPFLPAAFFAIDPQAAPLKSRKNLHEMGLLLVRHGETRHTISFILRKKSHRLFLIAPSQMPRFSVSLSQRRTLRSFFLLLRGLPVIDTSEI